MSSGLFIGVILSTIILSLPMPKELYLNNLKGKIAFLTAVIGDPETIEAFVSGSHIDDGRHSDAKSRIDLMLILLVFIGYSEDKADCWQRLNEWSNSTPMLLGERNPIDYLVNGDDFSASLWLGVAFNEVLSSEQYMWVTDDRVDAALRQFQPMIDTMVDAWAED